MSRATTPLLGPGVCDAICGRQSSGVPHLPPRSSTCSCTPYSARPRVLCGTVTEGTAASGPGAQCQSMTMYLYCILVHNDQKPAQVCGLVAHCMLLTNTAMASNNAHRCHTCRHFEAPNDLCLLVHTAPTSRYALHQEPLPQTLAQPIHCKMRYRSAAQEELPAVCALRRRRLDVELLLVITAAACSACGSR